MNEIETSLQNTIDSAGWMEGAASPTRIKDFLKRRIAATALDGIEL